MKKWPLDIDFRPKYLFSSGLFAHHGRSLGAANQATAEDHIPGYEGYGAGSGQRDPGRGLQGQALRG